ncbi:IPP transferase-domain-containing protein [Aspergillus desertorum]
MRPLVAVVGATGTGKSKLAVDIASRFNGEVINGDAMQMYRGLPIITNQIPVEERNGIPHHLISCIDLEENPWRISMFRRECLRLINDIHARGKLPILVGGTHYYTQSVLFQDQLVSKEPESSDEETGTYPADDVNSAVKWPILDAEPELVLQKLREVDPIMADHWHPKDTRKIRRSLEIYFQTGKPASQVYAEQRQSKLATANNDIGFGAGRLRFDTAIFWVQSEKAALEERLFKRVDIMVEQGLLSEASRMSDYLQEQKAQGVTVDQTRGVWVSIGFKELAPYLNALGEGCRTEKELEALKQSCIGSVKIATRQYAMSQLKWIRNKLWTGLAGADATDRLYLLDSTNVEDWTRNTTEPSERVVAALVEERPLPDPKSLSKFAKKTLEALEVKSLPTDHRPTRCITCDICRKTLTNEEQWHIHINGSVHKRVLKSLAKKRERDAYLQKRQESLENTLENVPDSAEGPDLGALPKEDVVSTKI